MPQVRATTGHRHEIAYRKIPKPGGLAFVQAVCLCDRPLGPPRFYRGQAEEDAREHMAEFAKQGMGRPTKKRGS